MQNQVITQLVQFLIGSSAIAGIVVFLGKEITKLILSKDLEKFKAELEQESFKFKTRFEKLHTERAEVIKNIYQKIDKAQQALGSLIQPFQMVGEPPIEEKAKTAAKELNEFAGYYSQNKIFLEKSLVIEIDKLAKMFRDAWYDFQLSQDLERKEKLDAWNKAWKNISEESQKGRELLEDKFREVLGVE